MQIGTKPPWYLTRLLMILCWVCWILTFFITVTVFQAVLHVRVVSQIVQNAERGLMKFSEDLVVAAPLSVTAREKIDEMLMRYYIDMRYSVLPDAEEMTNRWEEGGIVAYLSAPEAYREFRSTFKNAAAFEEARPRVVDILNVNRNGRQYTVDFDLYTFDGALNWVRSSKRLVVDFSYSARRVLLGGKLSNPNGFIVTRVNESDRRDSTQ